MGLDAAVRAARAETAQPRRRRAGRWAKPGFQRRMVHRPDQARAQRRRAARLHGVAH